jgi:large subunit ribosomal protein L25
MRRASLNVAPRERTGKGVARKLRAAGRVPAVLYGQDEIPQVLSIDRRTVATLIRGESGENTIFDIHIEGGDEGGSILALARSAQWDPISERLLHVDLLRISADHPIHTTIPIRLVGTPAGVKVGGILEHLLRHLEVRCLPLEIPEAVEISVERLEIGQSMTVADLEVPEGVTVLSDLRSAVALVESPAKLAAAETAAEEAAKAAEEPATEEAGDEESKEKEEE